MRIRILFLLFVGIWIVSGCTSLRRDTALGGAGEYGLGSSDVAVSALPDARESLSEPGF